MMHIIWNCFLLKIASLYPTMMRRWVFCKERLYLIEKIDLIQYFNNQDGPIPNERTIEKRDFLL